MRLGNFGLILLLVVAAMGAGALFAHLMTPASQTEIENPFDREEPSEDAIEILVVDAAGRPMDRVGVWLWAPGRVVRGQTNGDGLVRIDFAGDELGVAVVVSGFVPHVGKIVGDRGYRVRLTAGRRLAGRLRGDLLFPVAVRVTGQLGGGLDYVPARVRSDLARALRRTAWTDDRGRFVLTGFADDWSGSVGSPAGHAFLVGDRLSRTVDVELTEDIDLELVRTPSVSGYVVWSSTGEPVMGAEVSVRAELENGAKIDWRTGRTGFDGGFAVEVWTNTADALGADVVRADVRIRYRGAVPLEASFDQEALAAPQGERVLPVDPPESSVRIGSSASGVEFR